MALYYGCCKLAHASALGQHNSSSSAAPPPPTPSILHTQPQVLGPLLGKVQIPRTACRAALTPLVCPCLPCLARSPGRRRMAATTSPLRTRPTLLSSGPTSRTGSRTASRCQRAGTPCRLSSSTAPLPTSRCGRQGGGLGRECSCKSRVDWVLFVLANTQHRVHLYVPQHAAFQLAVTCSCHRALPPFMLHHGHQTMQCCLCMAAGPTACLLLHTS
jgi:hypothetical protein